MAKKKYRAYQMFDPSGFPRVYVGSFVTKKERDAFIQGYQKGVYNHLVFQKYGLEGLKNGKRI